MAKRGYFSQPPRLKAWYLWSSPFQVFVLMSISPPANSWSDIANSKEQAQGTPEHMDYGNNEVYSLQVFIQFEVKKKAISRPRSVFLLFFALGCSCVFGVVLYLSTSGIKDIA